MLVQFGFGLLSRISISLLKNADGVFLGAFNPGKLIIVTFFLPADDPFAELEPL
jgi:hypothetical protein